MNRDIKTRDEIIFGTYEPDKYHYGGIRRFNCPPEMIMTLLEKDFIDPDECQNDSPMTKEFMELLDDYPYYTAFECYAVDEKRPDYRVTIEGISTELPDTEYDWLTELVSHFRFADEFTLEHNNGSYYLRAWWD